MAFIKYNNVKISGIAAAVPTRVKEIRELPFFAPGEAERVIGVTHVERSRMVREGQCCSDLCYEATLKLLEKLQWDKSKIEAIVFVSLSRDYLTPATACVLQDRLGLSKDCLAFDIPFACSGYVYGLSILSGMINSGSIKKALLLVGETTSVQQSPLDKVLWPLHGDAGTATALEFDENAVPMYFHLGSDGSGADSIIQTAGGTRVPVTPEDFEMREVEPGVIKNGFQGQMDGMNVFSFSVKEPPRSILRLCEHFELSLENIDYLLLHQANKYMDDKIANKLKVPQEKVPYSIMQYGNTSSASIPMTVVVGVGQSIENQKADCIMCGFGSGLSWGSAFVTLDHIVCPELVEVE